MADSKPFDVVLFGATGYTGRLTAEYLAAARTARPLRWAIAGRSRDKLEALKRDLAKLGEAGRAVELVIADVGDEASLRALAQKARVVATTVGPYIRYGEPLVKACVEAGAHYVDLTGEPEFVDAMIARYHAAAEAARVKIVNACGFDSIPHDLGAYFTLKALERRLSPAQRGKVPVTIEGVVRARGQFSGGTWHSAVTAMGRARSYAAERKRRGSVLPTVGEGRKFGATPARIAHRDDFGLWLVPMPTIDPQVVRRSARLLPEYGPDFRYGHFMGLKKLRDVVAVVGGVSTVFLLAQLAPTRNLLLKLRDPGEGPSEEQRKNGFFKVLFVARGGDQEVRCEVTGGDPGYAETAKMLAESALCLAFDSTPAVHGVVPPAAAMGQPLIDRLVAADMRFSETTKVANGAASALRSVELTN